MIMKLPRTLAPMPTQPSNVEAAPAWWEGGEFVDESRLSLLIGTPLSSRTIPVPSDLVLAADEDDFAGWMLPPRTLSEPRLEESAKARLAAVSHGTEETRKSLTEASPDTGSSWISSISGAFCTLLFAFLLLTLAWRPPAIAAGAALPVPLLLEEHSLSQGPAAQQPPQELSARSRADH